MDRAVVDRAFLHDEVRGVDLPGEMRGVPQLDEFVGLDPALHAAGDRHNASRQVPAHGARAADHQP
ncbi:MAG: hypothetical protein AAB368_12745, partial [bacterium]